MPDNTEQLLGLLGPAGLPPINALTGSDLERQKFSAVQSGDSGRLNRIQNVQVLRRQLGSPLGPLEDHLLNTNQNGPTISETLSNLNPFEQINQAIRQ